MSIILGVNLGPSFAEYCLVDTARPKQPLAFKRAYIPTESLATSLRQFLSEQPAYQPEKAILASSLLEKILDTKLGGTVAQVVTKGFENWPLLRQKLQKNYFELTPQRTEALASQELIFGVTERINCHGKILKPVIISELEFIAAKLKLMKVERVCINLLFAEQNPTHQKQISAYFKENGFEVFTSQDYDKMNDEILAWRKNVLNAALSGTFKEIQSELIEATSSTFKVEQIYFVDGDSSLFQNDINRISSSLFGPAMALSLFYKKHSSVLVLGQEKWQLLKPNQKQETWQSPWGPLAGVVPSCCPILIQPTTELIADQFAAGFDWSHETLGFEPGPMSFGRGFRPTLFDLLSVVHRPKELAPFMNESGIKKFLDHLTAMKKHSPSSTNDSLDNLIQSLMNDVVDRIALQILLEVDDKSAPILCTGIFADILFTSLQLRWPELKWELCPFAKEAESLSVAHLGWNS